MRSEQSGLHIQTEFFKNKRPQEERNAGLPIHFFLSEWQKNGVFSLKSASLTPHLPHKTKNKNHKLTHRLPIDSKENHHCLTFLSLLDKHWAKLSSVKNFIRLILHPYEMKSTAVNKHA